MTTRLERLNELLKDPALNLPTFRQTVTPAFGNLQWLKSKLPKNPACGAELTMLLSLDAKELLKPNEMIGTPSEQFAGCTEFVAA